MEVQSLDAAIIKQETCETVLHQVYIHLFRAFQIGSRAKGISNPVGALLIIKNEIEAIGGILERHQYVFLQPRIYLHRLNETASADLNLRPPNDDDEKAVIKTEYDEVIVKRELDAAETDPSLLPQSISNHLTTLSTTGDNGNCYNDDLDDGDVQLPPPSPEFRDHAPIPDNSAPAMDIASVTSSEELPESQFDGRYCKLCRVSLWDQANDEEFKRLKDDHMLKVHPLRVFVCQCEEVICDKQDLENHSAKHPEATIRTLIKDESCPVCEFRFLTPTGHMTKETKYFWNVRGDVSFVTNHLKQCQRRKRYLLSSEKLEKCNHCKEKFVPRFMYRHVLKEHGSIMRQCETCGEWLDSKLMPHHKAKVHTRKRKILEKKKAWEEMKFEYPCDICQTDVVIPQVNDPVVAKHTHMFDCHSELILKCECGSYVMDDGEKESHAKDHPEMALKKLKDLVEAPTCSTCDLQFFDDEGRMSQELAYFWFTKKDEDFVSDHLKQCLGTQAFRKERVCRECRVSTRRYLHWKHAIQCHKEKLVKCAGCRGWFLKVSIGSHRPLCAFLEKKTPKVGNYKKTSDQQSFVCSHCGQTFDDKKIYQRHVNLHKFREEKAKLIKCNICDKMISAVRFSGHELYHVKHDGKLYTCQYCGKQYPYKTYYRHVRAHERKIRDGPKREKCDICGKIVHSVWGHKQYMHKERPRYYCKTCGQSFAEPRGLRRHETLHTSTFLHKCSYCDKGYNVKTALEYHEDTVHTKVKRFKCTVTGCGEAFFVNLYLRRHMEKAHSIHVETRKCPPATSFTPQFFFPQSST